ncbi:type I polyketide synthase, partial [Actinocorallia longicatena]|uniref:type I polyketide synthase n=1 Tax=Actinocorallia longicatena TaxID=111803 RepID=UPI0031D3182B
MGEPIAIIGMGCRLPGGVRSPEDLWDVVAGERDATRDLPLDRGWDLARHYDPARTGRIGTFYQQRGGFLDAPGEFDAEFFGIGPHEAAAMHPQQRLLLVTAWEAAERAGIDPVTLRDTVTGAYAGVFAVDYGPRLHEGTAEVESHLYLGSAVGSSSGRVSYALGLLGPSVTVETQCSSALTAVHLAVQALRAGECGLAFAGGACVMGTPGMLVAFSRQRAIAADGRSRSFSDAPNGFGVAEGAATVLLERLADARAAGRRILGVIRGSALSQDGATKYMAVPSSAAQQAVIRRALADAGLSAPEVDLVEAHGTGTKVGDPLEAASVLATYGQGRPEGSPVHLGSLKSNIGHTMAASGLAAIVKVVMAMRHGVLPRSLYSERLNPKIDWASGQVSVLSRARPWERAGRPRRAGVLSYGITGTNAHVIVEEWPQEDPPPPAVAAAVPVPWVLSARTPRALAEQAGRLRAWLAERPAERITDVGWSLATTRTRFEHRGIAVGRDRATLMAELDALQHGRRGRGLVTAAAAPGATPVFLFPGDGPVRRGTGLDLMAESPGFAGRMRECGLALAPLVGWDLLDVLRDGPGPEAAQAVRFALMVSLAGLWRDHGVEPAELAAYGVGEPAAAVVAGTMTLAEAAAEVARRGHALPGLADHGRDGRDAYRRRIEDLAATGARVFVELGLGPAAGRSPLPAGSAAVATLRRDSPGLDGFVTELAQVHAHGAAIGWAPLLPGARTVELPTYAFQPRRHWLDATGGTDLAAAGLQHPDHPLLGAQTPLAGTGGFLFTGRLSTRTHPWLAGHSVRGSAVLPAAVLLELALQAAHRSGAEAVAELLPETPLTVAPDEDVHLQVAVGAPGHSGDRPITIHARPATGASWIRLAVGALAARAPRGEPPVALPGDAVPVDLGGFYDRSARYGPAFHALRRAWRHGEDRYADLELPAAPDGFGLHPALLDALLHALFLDDPARPLTPSSWRGARLAATGARALRVRLSPVPGPVPAAYTVSAADPEGGPVLHVDRVVVRPLPEDGPAPAVVRDALFVTSWTPRAPGPEAPVGEYAVLDLRPGFGPPGARAVRSAATGALRMLRERPGRVLVITHGAVAAGPEEAVPDLVHAPVWGLVRAAQAENPDRIVLADIDRDGRSAELLRTVMSLGEPLLALRGGVPLVPGLARLPDAGSRGTPLRPGGTVLVTGGPDGLCGPVARHLVTGHGARRIVLAARGGPAAPGAAELCAELTALGGEAVSDACDVAEREELAALLAREPVDAVIHIPVVPGDAGFTALDADGLDRTLREGTDAVLHLHDLTAGHDLRAFVVFTPAAGRLGTAGHAGLAASAAFFDGLARTRRARGLPATSLAWG